MEASSVSAWTRTTTLAALIAASKDGISPPARTWAASTSEHPSRKTVAALFGTFSAACAEAGLETASEGAARHRRDRKAARRSGKTLPASEAPIPRWQRERAEKRRLQMTEDIATGALTVRQMTDDERAAWAQRKRPARYVPLDAAELVVPGVAPPRPSSLVRGDDPLESA